MGQLAPQPDLTRQCAFDLRSQLVEFSLESFPLDRTASGARSFPAGGIRGLRRLSCTTLTDVRPKPPLSQQKVEKMRAREAKVGLEQDDDAAKWLEQNAPPEAPQLPKSLGKNKTLHQWRRNQRP